MVVVVVVICYDCSVKILYRTITTTYMSDYSFAMLRQAQHEDSRGLHPELVEGYNANKSADVLT
jgi:hypothetical protein